MPAGDAIKTVLRFQYSFDKFLSCRFVAGTLLPTVLIDDLLSYFSILARSL